jgi:hypothetical protein
MLHFELKLWRHKNRYKMQRIVNTILKYDCFSILRRYAEVAWFLRYRVAIVWGTGSMSDVWERRVSDYPSAVHRVLGYRTACQMSFASICSKSAPTHRHDCGYFRKLHYNEQEENWSEFASIISLWHANLSLILLASQF